AAEANRTYRALRLQGRATLGNLSRTRLRVSPGTAVIAAYAVNELPPAVRAELLARLLDAGGRGARLLIVEPIARRTAPWWGEWSRAFEHAGGRADDWRFPAALPEFQRRLARAAGLDPSELTARSLHKA
ncbi:MAG TPA: hypothetical protein VLD67_08045, partial [Vicinamibacterales bacterium]|nr:hypothetical protein [Vicinamibacterales bacterium]